MAEDSVENLRSSLLSSLHLPDEVVDWLIRIYEIAQTFDDYADGDNVSRERLDQLIWDTMIQTQINPFFKLYSTHLQPVLMLVFLKWKAADNAERANNVNEQTYVWRAGYFDLVLMCCLLCHGYQFAMSNADKILSIYNETYEEYKKEFANA